MQPRSWKQYIALITLKFSHKKMLLDLIILLFTHLLIQLQMDKFDDHKSQTNFNKNYIIIICSYYTSFINKIL